jgi:hypothetical protein
MIGGVIVLSLFLIALVAMVVVSQQYTAYQSTVNVMSQKDVDKFSEVLMTVYPGLAGNFVATGCGGSCNQYNMTLSNVGGVGVQIVRVYINSTGSGCTIAIGYCILNPAKTPTAYTFRMSDGFLNPGESLHTVRLWLPKSIVLPNQTLTPSNTVAIVTSRGRVFTFQYPFPAQGPAEPGKGAAPIIATGLMKIAYKGSGYDSGTDVCHKETNKLVLPTSGSTSATFVNPWITLTILNSVEGYSPPHFWVSANTTNSLTTSLTINQGNVILLVSDSGSNAKPFFVGGPLVGVVYPTNPVTFTPAGTSVQINAGDRFILIFGIVNGDLGATADDVYSGTATVNNGAGTQSEGDSFRALAIYLDGLFVRSAC